jgi:hypothetical protein
MRSSGATVSILWLNNCYALIDINQITEAKIKVLLKNLHFASYLCFQKCFESIIFQAILFERNAIDMRIFCE